MCAVPDPLPDLVDSMQALVDADTAGTTTEQHLVDVWWAVTAVRPHIPGDLGYRLTEIVEARLSERRRRDLHRHVDDLVSARIARALTVGLPVFEPGGLVALAEADTAVWRAAR